MPMINAAATARRLIPLRSPRMPGLLPALQNPPVHRRTTCDGPLDTSRYGFVSHPPPIVNDMETLLVVVLAALSGAALAAAYVSRVRPGLEDRDLRAVREEVRLLAE